MTLVVERGEALSNAESFASVSEYLGFIDSYMLGGETCEPKTEQITKALALAAKMMSDSLPWNGCIVRNTQRLAWPRNNVTDCEGRCYTCCQIPPQIVEANIVLAHQLLKGHVSAFTNETDPKIASLTMDKYNVQFVGGAIVKDLGGCGGTMTVSADRFSAIRSLIKCFVKSGAGGMKIKRS